MTILRIKIIIFWPNNMAASLHILRIYAKHGELRFAYIFIKSCYSGSWVIS